LADPVFCIELQLHQVENNRSSYYGKRLFYPLPGPSLNRVYFLLVALPYPMTQTIAFV